MTTNISQIQNSVIPHGYGEIGVKMSRQPLRPNIINITITGAIDSFWRDGHHSQLQEQAYSTVQWQAGKKLKCAAFSQ